jgi:hypothetical protein
MNTLYASVRASSALTRVSLILVHGKDAVYRCCVEGGVAFVVFSRKRQRFERREFDARKQLIRRLGEQIVLRLAVDGNALRQVARDGDPDGLTREVRIVGFPGIPRLNMR